MGNSRVKDRFALALDGKQVIALGLGVTVIVVGALVLGLNLGRRSMVAAAAAIAAPKDPLARLDEPLQVRDDAVELKAHQALTDTRPIDKTLPVPKVKATTVSIAPPPAPAIAAPGVAREERALAAPPAPPARAAVTRPEKSAAAAAAPARRGAYAIQIASLPTRGDAERFARQNASRSPRIVQADVPGKGRYYRVLVGSFDTQDAAKRQLAVLTRSGVSGIVTAAR
jgi:septal ring-binding cell division protein DamX